MLLKLIVKINKKEHTFLIRLHLGNERMMKDIQKYFLLLTTCIAIINAKIQLILKLENDKMLT